MPKARFRRFRRDLVDSEMGFSANRVHVIARRIRPTRSQAIMSAGDGACAAVDILARVEGKDVQD